MSSRFLKVRFLENHEVPINLDYSTVESEKLLPFAKSPVFFSFVKNFRQLTNCEGAKKVFELSLKNEREYRPGDTIRIIPRNDIETVDKLLLRLGLEDVANHPCQLELAKGTRKKHTIVPKHFHKRITTIRNIFQDDVDINTIPKKLFLKSLIEFTKDLEEISKLQLVTSLKGSQAYSQFICGPAKTMLGLLEELPSCHPPVELIFEHLPPLQPRPYSISSSPLNAELTITFFILEHENERKGVCTGWLEKSCSNSENPIVPFYYCVANKFQLPEDDNDPLILIATGTGIAPFQGFLQHQLKKNRPGNIWLFYGCTSYNTHLYKNDMEKYLDLGILSKLSVAYSRETSDKCYVQDKIEESKSEFIKWIVEKKAKLFFCGGHRADIEIIICKILKGNEQVSLNEAQQFMKSMQEDGRYSFDSWT